MGTHISRVKSVDLDSWTDEQMQSILSWGNARANKYWESKLAQGHMPSESKIENFIRTKYELKRWVMEGPMPDPSSLDVDGDDDVPLSLVKEKQVIQRKESLRKASLGQSQAPKNIPAPQGDLIGGDDPAPVQRSVSSAIPKVAAKAEPAPPRATSTKDSLLGLDFFGEPVAPPRPASTTGVNTSGAQSRPDLKQSILSLYATAPRPQPQAQPQQPMGGFGGMSSPSMGHQSQGSIGGFNDAFGGLSISNTTSPKPTAADPFASLGAATSNKRTSTNSSAFGGLGGGSFFDSKPSQPAAPTHQKQPSMGGMSAFGGFSSPAPAPTATSPPVQSSSSAMGDLFDLSAPVSQTTSFPPSSSTPTASTSSVFNLSSTQSKPLAPTPATTTTTNAFGGFSGADVWGGNEWNTPTPAAAAPAPAPVQKSPVLPKTTTNDFGWGSSASFANTPIVPGASGGFNPAPKVSADEEFGGWASSTGPATSNKTQSKPASGFGGDDLFTNVWQ